VDAGNVLGILLGDLFDVDAAHVAEDGYGQFGDGVVDDAGVVLLLHGLLESMSTQRGIAADSSLDVLGSGAGFVGS
jgi:hypothetical protein